ncbi:MAG: hypothetical protein K0S04_1148 [Herbinix sp.]|jgi:hypothetical protein|nr:hypothetical protein [Herbinix sp.]
MDSYSAVNNLNETINGFKSRVDIKIDSVNTSTASIRATTDRIYDSISKFKSDMIQNEEKQIAHENILRIDQILKEQFRDYEAIRRTIMGVVRDFDINLVRNSTIQELSEELWIANSRYWLSYVLIAVTAWVNNYPDIAKNALSEGVRRDSIKSTLFFCLMNLRFGRNEVAKQWLLEYIKILEPAKLQQESAVLLQAYLNGIFGTDKELENEVNKIIRGWINVLHMEKETSSEMVEAYQRFIENQASPVSCEYPTLTKYCANVNNIVSSHCNVAKYEALIQFIHSFDVELEQQSKENYKSRVDNILMNLISNYDKEELELKNQQTYFRMIINNGGRVDVAEQQYEEHNKLQPEGFNVGSQMVKWALYDENGQTDIQVRKFGLQNTKIWFNEAIENWTTKLQQELPLDFTLKIDLWSGVSNGNDYSEQVENMKTFYENNKFLIKYVNGLNILALLLLIVSIGLVLVTPFSLIGTALAAGFLLFNILTANKRYSELKKNSLESLSNCMNELADFKVFYENNKNKKDRLIAELEYL